MTRRTAIIPIPKGLEKHWLTPRPGSLAARILAQDAETARRAVDIVPKKPLARDAANMAVKDDIWYNQLVEDAKKDALGIKQWITTETDVRIPVFYGETKGAAIRRFFRQRAAGEPKSLKFKGVSYGRAKNGTEYTTSLNAAKRTQPEERRWRVDVHDAEDYDKTADVYTTLKGGVVAVVKTTDKNHTKGDIISVCGKKGTGERGRILLKIAIANGGDRLDSFEGNHTFYTRNGFEPVSWCRWSDEYAPDEWKQANGGKYETVPDDKLRVKREDVIFYRYTGRITTESAADFKKRVKASADYNKAKKVRDSVMDAQKREKYGRKKT